MVWRIAERMRLEPALPRTTSGSPSASTSVGAIMLGRRRPGGWRWKPSGLRSSSPSMLLRWMARARDHDPRALAVGAGHAARPAVGVEDRDVRGGAQARGEEAVGEARVGEAGEELGRALRVRALGDLDELERARRRRDPVEERERVGDQDPARRGRRVGEDLAPAVGDAHRLARDHRVGGEVGAGDHPAALGHPVRDRGGDVAGVERRRALAPQALERVGQLGVGEALALPRRTALGRVDRRALGRRVDDRREDLEDVGLRGVDRGAVAGEPDPRRAPARRAAASRSARPPRTPCGRAVDAARRGPDVEDLTASPKSTSTLTSGAGSAPSRSRPGASTKKSSRTASPPGGFTSM